MTLEVIRPDAPPSLAARLVRLQLKAMLRPLLRPGTPLAAQRGLTASLRWLVPPAKGVRSEAVTVPGAPGRPGFSGERHLPPGATAEDSQALVWFHGGGYSVCTPGTHRGLATQLARATGLATWLPAYRRAPEHPYPAQREDALDALAALEARGVNLRASVLGGDSAGAHLALAATLARRDQGLPLPRALLLVSPWADVSAEALPPGADDALLTPDWMRQVRDAAFPAQPGESAEQARERRSRPDASPLFADLHGLPPVLIQSSAVEQLASDAERLHAALSAERVDVRWQRWPGLWHDFHLHAGVVPEAGDAVARIAAWLRQPAS